MSKKKPGKRKKIHSIKKKSSKKISKVPKSKKTNPKYELTTETHKGDLLIVQESSGQIYKKLNYKIDNKKRSVMKINHSESWRSVLQEYSKNILIEKAQPLLADNNNEGLITKNSILFKENSHIMSQVNNYEILELQDEEKNHRIQIYKIMKAKKNGIEIDQKKLKELVNSVESLRKKIDIISEFSNAQALTHDLVLRIPEKKEGNVKFSSHSLINFLSNLNDIIDTVRPGILNIAEYKIVAVAPGSESIMLDMKEKDNVPPDPENLNKINETNNILADIFDSMHPLSEQGPLKEKIEVIKAKTDLTDQEIYEVSKKVLNLHPDPSSSFSDVGIVVNSKEITTSITFKKDEQLQMRKSKELIYQKVKPEESTEVFGQLQVMEEWDKKHKISIFDRDDKKSYNIHYEPTEENLKYIKRKIGSFIRVSRFRPPHDKRIWQLEKWLTE